MSTHAYTRELVDSHWNVNGGLSKEIELAFPARAFSVACAGIDVTIEFPVGLDAAEVAALDGIVAAHKLAFDPLDAARARRLEQIDRRTEELIAAGFTHAGKQFSLSTNAQIKWMGAYSLRSYFTTLGAKPQKVNTKDDSGTHSVADEAEVATIWQTVGVATLTILAVDAALKAQVRAATTLAGIAAVVDSR